MNKSNDKNKDEYYKNFDFLQSSEEKTVSENLKSQPLRPSTNFMTIDKINNQVITMERAIESIMTEKPADIDPTLLRMSATQQSLESKEMNKKVRAQNEYLEIIDSSESGQSNKKKPKKNNIQDIITENVFDINKFRDSKARNKILFGQFKKFYLSKVEVGINPENKVNDEKVKIIRVKKQKNNLVNSQQTQLKAEEIPVKIEQNIQKNNTGYDRLVFYSIPLCLCSLFLMSIVIKKKLKIKIK